jgi:translation initiation factor 2 subunit 2
MIATPNDDTKDTAMSHTPRTPPLSAALGAFTDASSAPADSAADGDVPAADSNPDGLDLSLMKKKKKKVKKEDGEAAEGAAAGAGDEAIDLSMKKKKKKKVPKEEDEFAKKLEALNLEGGEGAEAPADEGVQEGDMDKGTGIWAHDESRTINYDPLLSRFFALLAQKNPDHASTGTRSYKIPPPQCLREGNKKTIFANLPEICKRMKRADEHVTAYLFAELGTSGSVDGSRRLVIKGRFQQKQIENVLRTYIIGIPLYFAIQQRGRADIVIRICDVQDMPVSQHGAVQGRESSLVCPPTPQSKRMPANSLLASLPATRAVLVVQSRPSRLVSLPRSEREGRCRVKLPSHLGFFLPFWSLLSGSLLPAWRVEFHSIVIRGPPLPSLAHSQFSVAGPGT